jgi:translation elongation factor EF-Ts
MTIIHSVPHGTSEVLVQIFEEADFVSENQITISFHKKIHGAISFSDTRSISKINQAIEEISELIY